MLAWIRRLFAPPVLEDEEKARTAWLLNIVVLALLAGSTVITLAAAVVYVFRADPQTAYTLLSGIVMTLSFIALWFLARRGRLQLVSIVLLSFTWILITSWIYTTSGIASDSSSLTYALIVVLAGLLLGGRAAMVVTGISVVAVLGAYYAETTGLLVVAPREISLADPLFVIIPLVLTGVLLRYAIHSLSEALGRAQRNERAQIEAYRQLELLRASLEERVSDRTSELERRSMQLQVATEVSRAATSILDPEELIWEVAGLIRDRFDLYHVGLLLLDDRGEWAVYQAGSGQSGRKLRDAGFRLPVGGNSMVGWCTANARARVAQDVSLDAIHYRHDLVPRTRSEAALPLVARGQVLGALSVQSDRLGTFDPATVAILQTMADQVAVALDNARLFTQGQRALEATRRAYGQLSREAWTELLRSRLDWGYRFAHQGVVPAGGSWQPDMVEALQTGQVVVRNPEAVKGQDGAGEPAVILPLKVREDVIGVVSFYRDSEDQAWTAEETELLGRLADQLGTALESAQLFQETQRRVAREQAIRQVTERMRGAIDVEAILQNTVAELAKALGAPRAYVRLGTEAELLSDLRAGPAVGAPPAAGSAEGVKPDFSDRAQVEPSEGDADDA